MTLLAILPAFVLAADCGLSFDTANACNIYATSTLSYANFDVDSLGDASPVSLSMSTIAAEYEDHDRKKHGATVGTLVDKTATDLRWELGCSQIAGTKTVKLTVTRPTDFGADIYFGAEAVLMYPKDSWSKVADGEKEPYTFNSFGSKVPLEENRPDATDLEDNSEATSPVVNVFYEVSSKGDFEFKYVNPNLKYCSNSEDEATCTWTSLEFKETILRVGTPWADCDGGLEVGGVQDVGSIVPLYFGHPNLQRADYDTVIDVLSAKDADGAFVVTMPVYVALEIFTPETGNLVPETTAVYTDNSEKWTPGMPFTVDNTLASYTTCYKAGTPCPDNNNVCSADYCNLNQWNDIIAKLTANPNVKALGVIQAVGSAAPRTTDEMTADKLAYETLAVVDGWFFKGVSTQAHLNNVLPVSAAKGADKKSVISTGVPLFDASARTNPGAPDVWVTLTADATDLQKWNPFGWFPYVPTSEWAAMLYNVADEASKAQAMFDRGYGWVFLHSGASADAFSEPSSTLASMLATVQAGKPTGRRAQGEERRLAETEATTKWSCDDTLFQCVPVCLKTKGFSTVQVAESQCAGAPMDPCSCSCMFNAAWSCRGDDVVCTAQDTYSLEAQVVGDLVCSSRGTPKPERSEFVMRTANECEAVPTAQGSYPTEQCMEKYQAEKAVREATPAPTPAATTDKPVQDEVEVVEKKDTEQPENDIMSFSVPAALVAVNLIFA